MSNLDELISSIDANILSQYDEIVDDLVKKVKKESKSLVGSNQLISPVQEGEKYACQMRDALLQGMKEMDRFKDAMHSFQSNKQAYLTQEELVQLEEEFPVFLSEFSKIQLPDSMEDKTLQDLLGIPSFLLYCFYKVGYGLAQQGLHEEAENIFFMLTVINPLVKDYWMALGFSAKECGHYEKATTAFTMSSFMDDNDPLPYLHSVESLLALGNRSDAEIGLQEAMEVIGKSENPEQWDGLLEEIKLKMNG